MRNQSIPRRGFLLAALLIVLIPSFASAQTSNVPPRITAAIDEANLTTLRGNTHPLARPEFDRGAAPLSLPMQRMLLVLKRSAQQETALDAFLDQQQDKSSPNYHHWLTPQQFGQQFGPADADIQTITAWLLSRGFTVNRVSNGRTVIEFSGTAAQVRDAFRTEIHKYAVNGEDHWANASDPQIPTALTPVVAGIDTLYNFPRHAMHHVDGVVSRSKDTGKLQSASPLFSLGGTCGVPGVSCYGLGPYDFATIYNVLPLWTANPATDGTGQTIAIVAETDISLQDIRSFRSYFGLPPSDPNIVLDGPDPGTVPGDETESDLDVEWAGAVAKGATIDFVISQTTEVSLGVDLSAQYVVDNNLAPILSESYGICELFLGSAGNQFYNQLWQQASAQGITALVATGDSGSAVCDRNAGTQGAAELGLSVSGISSTPYNVAVGGTDFNDLTNPGTYWNSVNSVPPGSPAGTPATFSALSYIPETTWNDSCTNAVFGNLLGFSQNAETNCNNTQLINAGFVTAVGASGGKSNCTTYDGTNPLSCTGGYSKPTWQTGADVPNDQKRDLPDVSLFAASGSPSGAFYLICEADVLQPGETSCDSADPNTYFFGVGGTSASTPAFAGIMALVDQKTGARQGNANYILYPLAAQPGASCNSSNGVGTNCVFYDVTNGTISMPCASGSPNCNVSIPGDQVGLLFANNAPAYNTTTGYDLATGLGSVNAANLVSKWTTFGVSLKHSSTSLTLNSGHTVNITHGQSVGFTASVAPVAPATGTPTGNLSLVANTGPNGQDGVQGFQLNSGSVTSTTNVLPGGSYTVTAHYPGDGTFAASDSTPPVAVNVAPEASQSNIAFELFNPSTGLQTNPNATTAQYGSLELLRMNITSQSGDTCAQNAPGQLGCPTGSVTVTNNGAPLDLGTYQLNSLGYAEDQSVQLPGGTNSLKVNYPGDNSFTGSNETATITITKDPTSTNVTGPANGVLGSFVPLTAFVNGSGLGIAPTGQVTFFSGSTQLGNPATVSGTGGGFSSNPNAVASIDASQLTLGNNSITASYSGDGNYAASTSAAANVDVQIVTTLALRSSNLTITHGTSVTFTATVTPTQAGGPGPTGAVTFGDSFGTLGTAPLTNGQAQFTTSSLPGGGLIEIFASYSGDVNYGFSQTNLVETVNLLATTTAVTTSSSTIQQGSSVTLTATVAPVQSGGPALTGTAQFFYAFSPQGSDTFIGSPVSLSNGQAQIQTSSLPANIQLVGASYSGDSNYASSNATVAESVTPAPTFTVTANPTTVSVAAPGQSGSTTLTFTAQNGFSSNGNVTVAPTCSGLPLETSCSISGQINLATNGTTTATLMFQTTAPSAAIPASRNRPNIFGWRITIGVPALVCLLSITFLTLRYRGRQRRWNFAVVFTALVLLAVSAGCGGGGGGGAAVQAAASRIQARPSVSPRFRLR